MVSYLYKIVSKVLASRLKRVLGGMISPSQTTFIQGRQILNGVIIVTEILDLAKRDKRECILFKVEFEKAYDCVCWNYLGYMMKRLGFGRNSLIR